jgi:hypothetical protein
MGEPVVDLNKSLKVSYANVNWTKLGKDRVK